MTRYYFHHIPERQQEEVMNHNTFEVDVVGLYNGFMDQSLRKMCIMIT